MDATGQPVPVMGGDGWQQGSGQAGPVVPGDRKSQKREGWRDEMQSSGRLRVGAEGAELSLFLSRLGIQEAFGVA